jgi:hypothetical protein
MPRMRLPREAALPFRYPLGLVVTWAADPTQPYLLHLRRWTDRQRLGPVIEYGVVAVADFPEGLLAWADEADLVPWQGEDGHRKA